MIVVALLSFISVVASQASLTGCTATNSSTSTVANSTDKCASLAIASCFPGNAQVISKKRGVIKMSQL